MVVALSWSRYFVWVFTYPNYDSYYSLLWGREILHGHLPRLRGLPRTRPSIPSGSLFGNAARAAGPRRRRPSDGARDDRLVFRGAGGRHVPPRGRLCFTPFVGALAAFLVLTRFDFPSLAVRAYIDVPFMATIVWAAALEAFAPPPRDDRVPCSWRQTGLMRPEAWILSGVYFLWMSLGRHLAAAGGSGRGADRDRPGAVGHDGLRWSPETRCSRCTSTQDLPRPTG